MLKKIRNYFSNLFTRLYNWYDNIGTYPLLQKPNGTFLKVTYNDVNFETNIAVPDHIQAWLAELPNKVKRIGNARGPRFLEGYLVEVTNEFTTDTLLYVTDIAEVLQPDAYLYRYLDMKDYIFSSGDLSSNKGPVRLCPAAFPYRRSEVKVHEKVYGKGNLIHKPNVKYK